jgi:hypothetical protein
LTNTWPNWLCTISASPSLSNSNTLTTSTCIPALMSLGTSLRGRKDLRLSRDACSCHDLVVGSTGRLDGDGERPD